MKPEDHDSQEWVDDLVRDHLQRQAKAVDTSKFSAALIDRVREEGIAADAMRGNSATSQRHDRGWSQVALTAIALSAVAVMAFLGGRSFTATTADAETILRDVQERHSQSVDRRYHVQFAPAPGFWNGRNMLKGPSETVLWTRGDRFWADATIGTLKLVYGRGDDGHLWVSPEPSKGIVFSESPEAIPDEVAMYCSINAMTVPALLDDVLGEFELRVDPPKPSDGRSSSSGNTIVWAHLKPGHQHERISSAVLEISRDSLLTRLILWTVEDGKPRGTVTFTLTETGQQSADQYQLSGHVASDATIEVHQFRKADDAQSSEDSRSNETPSPVENK